MPPPARRGDQSPAAVLCPSQRLARPLVARGALEIGIGIGIGIGRGHVGAVHVEERCVPVVRELLQRRGVLVGDEAHPLGELRSWGREGGWDERIGSWLVGRLAH